MNTWDAKMYQVSYLILSKALLNHNSTSTYHSLVLHENDFAYHTPSEAPCQHYLSCFSPDFDFDETLNVSKNVAIYA